ncbi:MAG: electron transfer flavoprotein subunit alpha/FixB family protein [Acidobacteriota bacterium]|jgi:electron transfer flavoprotein alpha subunit|nr:electron transfer flavoprotein subunit alpha/FixB family protein [Acidobacteriota bacterium]NLT34209.1 electron transfer flavoprotein subunit alpha/FixB family protein [Acidobacteriota bacterium]
MAQGILVFIEEREGRVKKPSLEALGAARRLADGLQEAVIALRIGTEEPSENLAAYGADRVMTVRHDLLQAYSTDGYAAALAQAIRSIQPRFVLSSASAMGRDLLPRVAAKLGVGLAQDCIEIHADGGRLECVRPIYAGKAYARVRLPLSPGMATLRPNVFSLGDPDSGRSAEAIDFAPELTAGQFRAVVREVKASAGQKVELTEANIIVSGGRGMKGPENFPLIEQLAGVLGGAVGASRSAVDSGWIDQQHQVGQTGKTVSPTCYIACGISGAIQHLAGMSSSKYVVAINKDPEAPIFSVADYGIVGDLFAVVPALTEEIRKLKSS